MKLLKENIFIALFLGLCITFITSFFVTNTLSTQEEYQLKIEHGDSLWKLADKYGSDESKESWINQVMALNNLQTAHIKTGDVLMIPKVNGEFHLDDGTEIAGNSK